MPKSMLFNSHQVGALGLSGVGMAERSNSGGKEAA